jgi:hypothetical protein
MRRVAVILVLGSLFGCAHHSHRNDHEVLVTRDAADIEHCKHIGAVQSLPPYALPGEDLQQIRRRTVAAGADTVLLDTSRSASTTGIAYRCRTT